MLCYRSSSLSPPSSSSLLPLGWMDGMRVFIWYLDSYTLRAAMTAATAVGTCASSEDLQVPHGGEVVFSVSCWSSFFCWSSRWSFWSVLPVSSPLWSRPYTLSSFFVASSPPPQVKHFHPKITHTATFSRPYIIIALDSFSHHPCTHAHPAIHLRLGFFRISWTPSRRSLSMITQHSEVPPVCG